LTACAPHLDDTAADDIAAVVLNNMKMMVGVTIQSQLFGRAETGRRIR